MHGFEQGASLRPAVSVLFRVSGGIFPDSFGYEMGQSSCGDAFAWLSRITGRSIRDLASSNQHHLSSPTSGLSKHEIPIALDWFNGCRSPHNDSALTACIRGLTMDTSPEDLYSAILYGVVCGGRTITQSFVGSGLPVERLLLTGGLPHAVPALPQVSCV